MDLQRYVNRIGCQVHEPSLDYLEVLQRTHLQTVPFENLDVIRNIPIYLRLSSMYEKIVSRIRGGYCYELNGLFHWALQELGYDARIVPASVMRPSGEFAKKHTHVAIFVLIDETMYLVDVGFGNSQYAPLPLDGSEHTDVSGTYRVKHQHTNVYRLYRKDTDSWKTMYEFTTDEWTLTDFHEGCVFNQVSPESTFTHSDLVTIATNEGRITLKDNELTTIHHGVKTVKTLTKAEKVDVLMNTFKLKLS